MTFADKATVAAALADPPTVIADYDVTVEARKPAEERKPAEPSTNVYINNLPESTTEEELEDALVAYGAVEKVQLYADRGFAYVVYADVDNASAAVDASPLQFKGNNASVEFRRSRIPRRRGGRGGGGGGGGGGAALAEEGGEGSGGKRRRRRRKRNNKPLVDLEKQVYIKGVEKELSAEDVEPLVRDAIGASGEIVEVVKREGADFCFVVFADADGAEASVSACDAGNVNIGDSECIIEMRQPPANRGGDAAAAAE